MGSSVWWIYNESKQLARLMDRYAITRVRSIALLSTLVEKHSNFFTKTSINQLNNRSSSRHISFDSFQLL